MLLKLFDGKNIGPQAAILLLVWLGVFLYPVEIVPAFGFDPLYQLIFNKLVDNPILIRIVFAISITLAVGFTQHFLIIFGLVKRQHFHFLLLAPILLFSFPQAFSVSAHLLAIPILILGIAKLFQLSNQDNIISELSTSAVLFSIASLFYSTLIWEVFLIIISLIVFRQFRLREILVVFSAYCLPYIYLFTWFFVQDQLAIQWQGFMEQFQQFSINIHLPITTFPSQYAFYILVIPTSLFILFSLLSSLRSKLIQTRAYIVFTLWALGYSLFALPLIANGQIFHNQLVMFLLAAIFSIYLSEIRKNWIMEILIFMMLVLNTTTLIQALYA